MDITLDSQTVNVSLSHTLFLVWYLGTLVAIFGAISSIGVLFLNNINRRFADQQRQTEQRFADQQRQTEQRFVDQHRHIDQRFTDQLAYLDRRFADLRSHMDQRFEAVLSEIGEVKKDVREIRAVLMQPAQAAAAPGSHRMSEARTGAPQSERRESSTSPSPERPNASSAPDGPRQAGGGQELAVTQSLSASGRDPEG